MTLEELRTQGSIIFECISGSKAYGLDLPTSDTDLKGVFILPKEQFYGLDYVDQVSNESNDIVFYELKRFVELLYKNNPNLLEMLNVSEEHVLYRHPVFEMLRPELFISRLCKDTFAGYAMTQIKKARGLNKKILNPMQKERKNILNFCYVTNDQGSVPLTDWLDKKQMLQEKCGLVNVPQMKNMYGLFYDEEGRYQLRGIMRKETANDVTLSSIPRELKPVAHLYFNKEGYTTYCKNYKEYWEWVDKRNEERYKNTVQHGKNYDAKNMMHTFRLLDMAEEILEQGQIIVKRPNREELLNIRAGKFTYEELIDRAEEKVARIEELYQESLLPEQPDKKEVEQLLIKMREHWYKL